MFPMTITIHNVEQLSAVVHALDLRIAQDRPVRENPEPPKPETEKAEAPKQEKVSAPSTGTTSDSESSAPSGTGESSGDKDYTLDEAKRLTTDSVKAGKRNEIVALLKKFGVEQTAKLKPEQISAFCREAEELLK
jgi:hypothetical protein